jgi:hypothetical protein
VNSFGDLVVEIYGILTGPLTGPDSENPLWNTDIFINPPLTARDLYENLEVGLYSPIVSKLPKTFVTYTIPLDHFSGTTSNTTIIPETQSVGHSLTISL